MLSTRAAAARIEALCPAIQRDTEHVCDGASRFGFGRTSVLPAWREEADIQRRKHLRNGASSLSVGRTSIHAAWRDEADISVLLPAPLGPDVFDVVSNEGVHAFCLRRRTVAQAGTGRRGSRLKLLPISGAPVRAAGSSTTRRSSSPKQCG